jgi:hypothetical protein
VPTSPYVLISVPGKDESLNSINALWKKDEACGIGNAFRSKVGRTKIPDEN